MKKKWIFALPILILAIAGLLSAPHMVQSSIPSMYYITPNQKTYENAVQCSGNIQSNNLYEIRLGSAVVPEQILVQLGDRVENGQLLAKLTPEPETAARVNMGASLSGASLPAEAEALLGLLDEYGLSSYLGIDAASLAELGNQAIVGSELSVSAFAPPTEISSPVSGIVAELNLVENAMLGRGQVAVSVIDPSDYRVLVAVGEGDIAKIQLGNRAVVRGAAFSGKAYQGIVSKISPAAHKAYSGSGTDTVVDVEIVLLNPDNRLKPGFSVKAEISGGSDYELITVPYEAIRQDESNNEYVYTYENGILRKAPVVTGQELTNEVEILSGLSKESIVIFNPDASVKDGAMIQIKGRADVS